MEPIINFLNENNGAIIAIATLVLAGITLWYVIETMKMRKITHEMLRISNTPDVRVFLGNINGVGEIYTIDLCIQNIGTGFAYDLKFTGDFHRIHPVASRTSLAEYNIIKDGISYLGPGKFIPILLCFDYEKSSLPYPSINKKSDLPDPPINGKVNYRDSANTEYDARFCLDFEKLEGYPQLENQSLDNIAFYLRGIDDTLRDMQEKNKQ